MNLYQEKPVSVRSAVSGLPASGLEGAVTRECLRRLVRLGLPPKVIRGFLRGEVWVNESPSGKLRPPVLFDAERVKVIENAFDCKVYLAVRDCECDEKPIYYLLADRRPNLWRYERKCLTTCTPGYGWGYSPAVRMLYSDTNELLKCEIMIVKKRIGLELAKPLGTPITWEDYTDEEDDE